MFTEVILNATLEIPEGNVGQAIADLEEVLSQWSSRWEALTAGDIWRSGYPRRPIRLTGPSGYLALPVEKAGFPIRALTRFQMRDIRTVGELITRTRSELEQIPSFGKSTLDGVEKKLTEFGLKLAEERNNQ